MKEKEIHFPSGELSLEGVLHIPEGDAPFPAVIVCHPHPLYGGSMENNVVNSLCAALVKSGILALKFNFRGVGRSQGEFGEGIGEQEDVRAALSFVVGVKEVDAGRIGLAGYSAGAKFSFSVGVADDRIKALAAVSPPLSMYDFIPPEDCVKPKFLISGSLDNIAPSREFQKFCQGLPQPRECVTADGVDHFWWGKESILADRVAGFFAKALK
ncbi:alpha/beta hydrolase [Chloroflexota bacterium]